MSVKRDVIADVLGLPEDCVCCNDCDFKDENYCSFWKVEIENADTDFCSFFSADNMAG